MPTRKNKTTIVVVAVCLLAALILTFVSISRDKNAKPINVVVKSGMSAGDIAGLLKQNSLISSPTLFRLLSFFTGGKLIAGEYTLTKSMSTLDIVRKMRRGERNIYVLKIVEGYNIYTIADAMQNSGIMGKEEFMSLSRNEAFLKRSGIRADSLEGYLAPDTYHYSKEIDVDKFIEKIAQRTFKIFEEEDIRKRMESLKMDIHRTLTLASMIEKEAKRKEEKPLISAVFHNRLKKDMSLDCDPTVIYGTGAFSRPITKSDLIKYTPYNTYTFKGLPRGPIASPDKNSIMAALYPASTDDLYFVSRNDGTHVFSKDMKTHNRSVNKYQRVKNTKKQ